MARIELHQLDAEATPKPPYPAVLAKGFRVFFLAAALAAVALIPLWLAIFEGRLAAPARFGGPAWHGHEMVFGYAFAVIAGFLLTAVYNWVGRPHLVGVPLGALAALWAAGRLVMFGADHLPAGVVAAIDIAFLPVLAAVLTPPLIAARNWINLGFMGLLLLGAAINLAFHLDAMGVAALGGSTALLTMGIELLLVFVGILTGRIMVMFTENGVRGTQPKRVEWLERLALPSILAFAVVDSIPVPGAGIVAAILGFAAAVVHGWRLAGWETLRTFKTPLVWVLHMGYAWLILALVLKGLANLGLAPTMLAVHAMTVGALGSITLGMMARIGLGHTGRMILVPTRMAVAFGLIGVAALIRVVAPLLPTFYVELIAASGLCWTAAFAIFGFSYLSILAGPRTDGRPG